MRGSVSEVCVFRRDCVRAASVCVLCVCVYVRNAKVMLCQCPGRNYFPPEKCSKFAEIENVN